MQLSSHSCFFLYFVRFHFAFLLRARTFRILSFNFYQTEYHASLTRNFIPFVTKKKKNTASIIFEPRLATSIHIHVNIFLRFTIQSCQIFHNSWKFAVHVLERGEFSWDCVKGSLIKGVCFVVSSYLHALGERVGGREKRRRGHGRTREGGIENRVLSRDKDTMALRQKRLISNRRNTSTEDGSCKWIFIVEI